VVCLNDVILDLRTVEYGFYNPDFTAFHQSD
jgi:hypothetical protein